MAVGNVRAGFVAWLALLTGVALAVAVTDWPGFVTMRGAAWVLALHAVSALVIVAAAVRDLGRRRRYGVVAAAFAAIALVVAAAWLGRNLAQPAWAWMHAATGACLLLWLGDVALPRWATPAVLALAFVGGTVWCLAAAPPPLAAPSAARVRAASPIEAFETHADGCRACHGDVAGKIHQQHGPTLACAYCHRGEPRSREAAVAHGSDLDVRRPPLLRGPFAQATCVGCHAPHGPPQGAEAWLQGRRLWQEGGCAGCHNSPDGRLGPDLAPLAWAWNVAPLSTTGVAWAAAGWPSHAAFLGEAIRAPRTHVPADLAPQAQPAHMPSYPYNDTEIRDLTVFLISQAAWAYPASLSGPAPAPPAVSAASTGAALFNDPEIGCALCHRLDGKGGDFGPPLDAWRGRDAEALAALLADAGRTRLTGYPPLMPSDYGERLDAAALAALATYVTRQQRTP